jgi:hypothetical protein
MKRNINKAKRKFLICIGLMSFLVLLNKTGFAQNDSTASTPAVEAPVKQKPAKNTFHSVCIPVPLPVEFIRNMIHSVNENMGYFLMKSVRTVYDVLPCME